MNENGYIRLVFVNQKPNNEKLNVICIFFVESEYADGRLDHTPSVSYRLRHSVLLNKLLQDSLLQGNYDQVAYLMTALSRFPERLPEQLWRVSSDPMKILSFEQCNLVRWLELYIERNLLCLNLKTSHSDMERFYWLSL